MKTKLQILFSVLFLFFALFAHAQETVVSGKVISADDSGALPGVNVLVKGTTTGVVTDIDGNYSLSVPSNATLTFSFIGFIQQEVQVGNQSQINIVLQTDVTELSEIVITGYGDKDARTITGSAAIVDARTIENVPIASFDQILQGQAPGLLAQSNTGQPGSSGSVTIRGKSSINSGTEPLYILDGLPITSGVFRNLNSNDIENVSVLKDAIGTSIYGARGSNGVIVITTKSGKPGKAQFNYSYQYGITQAPDDFLPVLNTNEKIDLEILRGVGVSSLSSEAIAELRTIETDWQKELFQDGILQAHEVSASGGNENVTYFVSGNYRTQEGTVKFTSFDKYGARFNIKVEDGSFRFGSNFNLAYSETQGTREGDAFIGSPLNALYWSNPYETVFDSDGNYTQLRSGQPNGVQEIALNKRKFNEAQVIGSVYGEYDFGFLQGLSLRSVWGVDYLNTDTNRFTDPTTNPGGQSSGGSGDLFRRNNRRVTFTGTNSLNYTRDFGEDHSFSIGLFQEFNYRNVEGFNFRGFGFTGKLQNEAGITVGSATNSFIPTVGGAGTSSSLVSYFVSASYGFKDRYFIDFVGRRDGSSRFGKNKQFANFGSVGASWIISDESFMESFAGTLNFLKIKSSYGSVGNQGVGDFAALATFAPTTYDGQSGIFANKVADPNLKWETTNMFNVGLDFGLFKDRITGSIEYYDNTTVDLFLAQQLSRTTGFQTQTRNIGELKNSGVEVGLDIAIVQASDIRWSVGANFSYNKNEITKLSDDDQDITTATRIDRVGEPLSSNYVVPYVGVNPANGDALYLTSDGQVTNVFNSSDKRVFGTRNAPYYGGFTNTISYKGLELYALFSWVYGNEIFNNERTNIDNPAFIPDNVSRDLLRAWQKPGDITDIPRFATVNGVTENTYQSQTSRYLENGSYLRLRNVTLSYNLPQSVLGNIKMRNVKVYLQGQNLLTFTDYSGADPEDTNSFFLGAVYPASKTYTFGLNIGF